MTQPALTTYSLRRRLVKVLVLLVGALWIGTAMLAFRTAHHEADEVFDAHLVQVAETLLTLVDAGDGEKVADELSEELAEHEHRYELPLRFQVWATDDGRAKLLVRSPDAPRKRLITRSGFVDRDFEGRLWRFYGVSDDDGDVFVVVGQEHGARYAMATEMAINQLLPIAFGLPLMAFAVWWAVGRATRPLGTTARSVSAMSPDALTPVVPGDAVPKEVAPLIDALNRLIARVEAAFEKERRFTADAAHELRTPLAALKVQAQVARRAVEDATRIHALDQVLVGVDRMTHLVEQLLTLARLEPQAAGTAAAFSPVALDAVAEQVCAQLAPAAIASDQALELDTEPVTVSGNTVWLEVLTRNLIDNAMRYTPSGGRIHVRVSVTAKTATLRVADDGPGMSPAQQTALMSRFARGNEHSREGAGLGLSIVERIVELHGAQLTFEAGLARDGGHGLSVVVRLPAR